MAESDVPEAPASDPPAAECDAAGQPADERSAEPDEQPPPSGEPAAIAQPAARSEPRARGRVSPAETDRRGGLGAPPQPADLIPLSRTVTGPAISPRMTALFGTLFGLATIASVFALLIQVFPVQEDPAAIAPDLAATEGEPASDADGIINEHKRKRTALPSPWRLRSLDTDPAVRIIRGQMKRRSFIVTLNDNGVPKAEVYRILKAMEGVRKFDRCGRNDTFAVALNRTTRKVTAFEYEVNPTTIYQVRADDNGLLRGEQLDMKVNEEQFATAFFVGPELEWSYRAAGLEEGVLGVVNEALSGRTSTEAFEEGAIVRLILVEKTVLGLFYRYERVEALEYRPANPQKKPMRSYYYKSGRRGGYADERGRQRVAEGGWRSPVPGAPVTSPFNPKRMHPILKRIMPHTGTDFGAPSGTPVYAAFRGVVTYVGPRGGYGNYITIDHPNGVETSYAHLSRYARGLKKDMKVGTRQLIGYVGTTGRSTGPHLHFGAKRNGKWFNPMDLKLDALRLLPVAQRGKFLALKQQLDVKIDAIPLPEPPPPRPDAPVAAATDDPSTADPATPADDPEPPGGDPEPPPPSDDGDSLVGEDLSVEPE